MSTVTALMWPPPPGWTRTLTCCSIPVTRQPTISIAAASPSPCSAGLWVPSATRRNTGSHSQLQMLAPSVPYGECSDCSKSSFWCECASAHSELRLRIALRLPRGGNYDWLCRRACPYVSDSRSPVVRVFSSGRQERLPGERKFSDFLYAGCTENCRKRSRPSALLSIPASRTDIFGSSSAGSALCYCILGQGDGALPSIVGLSQAGHPGRGTRRRAAGPATRLRHGSGTRLSGRGGRFLPG